MACHGRLAEIILHLTNIVYFCGGVAVLVVGAIGLGNPVIVANALSYVPQMPQLALVMYLPGVTQGPSIYLTIAGSLAIILSVVGCGGAFKRSRCGVFLFGGCTLIFMLFNIALIMFYAIDSYYVQSNIETSMNVTLKSSFQPVTISSSGAIQLPSSSNANAQAWVNMQFEQGCCGVVGYEDYSYFSWNNNFTVNGVTINNAVVPPSCCLQNTQYTVASTTSDFVNLASCLTSPPRYTNTLGCSIYVADVILHYNYIYCVVAAGLTALQAIVLCMTMWLLVVHFDRVRSDL